MRILLSLLLLGATTVSAQTPFRLVDPMLSVDGVRVATSGAPLAQEAFGALTIGVPGDGAYTVSERPFAGARRAGQFDGDGLYFAVNGRSVRLRSQEAILSDGGPAPAYVAYVPAQHQTKPGVARLAVAEVAAGGSRRSMPTSPPRTPGSGQRPSRDTRPAARPLRNSDADRLRRQLDRLGAGRQRLARERDRRITVRNAARRTRLLADRSPTDPQPNSLDAERAALASDRALLDADRAALAAERRTFEALRRSRPNTPALDERHVLLDRLAAAQAEREALVAERDRLALELEALRNGQAATNSASTITPPLPAGNGSTADLPGFDFGRLQNPDVVRHRLDESDYPQSATDSRIEGDVLVLFETDSTGRVVRTAVPQPLGGGLDALAEGIVRDMRFAPRAADGETTGLRSQVVVRFEL